MNFFLKNIFGTVVETANVHTRSNRKQFNFYLLYLAIIFFLGILSDLSILFYSVKNKYMMFISSLSIKILIVSLIPFLTLSIRRLHDINLSGAWVIIYLPIFFMITGKFSGIPYREVFPVFYNIAVLALWVLNLILIFKKSYPKDNKYGKAIR